jgi:hypothetical protein
MGSFVVEDCRTRLLWCPCLALRGGGIDFRSVLLAQLGENRTVAVSDTHYFYDIPDIIVTFLGNYMKQI